MYARGERTLGTGIPQTAPGNHEPCAPPPAFGTRDAIDPPGAGTLAGNAEPEATLTGSGVATTGAADAGRRFGVEARPSAPLA